MGNSPSSCHPLAEWSTDDVSKALHGMGRKFEAYADAVSENQVDGSLLLSFLQDGTLDETFDDLGLSNRLHRRVLTKKLQDLSQQRQEQQQNVESMPMTLFQAFDDITQEALDKTDSAIYAGLHLVKDNGYLVLSGKFRDRTQHLKRFALQTSSQTAFNAFCNERTEDYLEEPLLFGGAESELIDPTLQPTVSAHILRDDRNKRVGAICVLKLEDKLTEQNQDTLERKQKVDASKALLLKNLAAEAERQMQERKAILERTASLDYQLQLTQNPTIQDGMKEHVMACIKNRRQAVLPTVSIGSSSSLTSGEDGTETEMDASHSHKKRSAPDEKPSSVDKKFKNGQEIDTASDPMFQDGRATSNEAVKHLPLTFYDKIDAAGGPRPPVRKRDMDVQAVVDEMNLSSITPESDIGKRIKKIVQLVTSLFDFSMGMMVFNDQYFANSIAVVATTQKAKDLFNNGFQVVNRDVDGLPFFCKNDRACSMCNYPMFSGKTLIVPDAANDRTFQWLYKNTGIQSYVGSPCVDAAGRSIANLCVFDHKARHDITGDAIRMHFEQYSYMLLQELQNWSMKNKMQTLEKERSALMARVQSEKSLPPTGKAALVRTDVQGSTALWEADPSEMEEALALHSKILRECSAKYNGYEIGTEGDAFFLAFHDPVDALAFAIQAQSQLYNAPWSDGILALDDAAEIEGSMRGLRVRMGIHFGVVKTKENEISKRIQYSGPSFHLSKAVEDMAHGGQILTTMETWNLASTLGSSAIGAYQVVDMGVHVLQKGASVKENGVVSKGIVQIVPDELSFNYFKARRRSDTATDDEFLQDLVQSRGTLLGRQFAPVLTKRQISPSFLDAPYENNEATMLFLYTSEVEKEHGAYTSNCQDILESLVRLIGELLSKFGCGYHCKDFMLAFPIPSDAVRFTFIFFQTLRDRESRDADSTKRVSGLVKFGCVHGKFVSMGPDLQTGRADYFGKVVNRAARVASAAAPGTTYLGIPLSGNASDALSPNLDPDIRSTFIGARRVKGMKSEIALFSCTDASVI